MSHFSWFDWKQSRIVGKDDLQAIKNVKPQHGEVD